MIKRLLDEKGGVRVTRLRAVSSVEVRRPQRMVSARHINFHISATALVQPNWEVLLVRTSSVSARSNVPHRWR